MALRIAEQAALTDPGRQRSANEDNYVERAPYFAVADGMGGAKAGEVASQLAAEAFEDQPAEDAGPEERLRDIAQGANRRIYELAQRDEAHRGMGTTLTAAHVGGDTISLGHVGDSRAYLLRDGELQQVTRDHSLVAELERTGQLTAEAAETHPQRSIITRALGPEPDVDVDTYTVTGRPGDVFLLCSDGLTTMIGDDEVAGILRSSPSLAEAAQGLVRAANQSGGKDNITVVLFRLDDEDASGAASPDETIAGQLSAEDVQAAAAPATLRPPAQPAPPAAPPSTVEGAQPAPAPPRPAATQGRRRRGGRRALGLLVALLLVGAIGAGLYALGRQVYFVGTDDAGLVTLYRGLPYDLPFGVELYSEEYSSGVPARVIPASRRRRVLDHEWRGREDAEDLVRQLERGRIEELGR